MLTTIVVGALSAAALIQATDTIVQADGATRLSVDVFRGEVVVRTWDRDAVQIQADHSPSLRIEVGRTGRTLSIDTDVERGLGLNDEVGYELTVPRGFDLNIDGVTLSVDIRGTEGQVDVNTVYGSINLEGGRESIHLGTVAGEIVVEGAEGSLQVNGVGGNVTIRNCTGDIAAESVGGSLTLEGVSSRDVEVGTVSGTLRYEGSIEDGGVYNFGSHAGQIWVYLPRGINARVDAVTLAGHMEIDYPGAPSEPKSGHGLPGLSEKELSFEVGTGSASVEIETFAGTIHILQRGGDL